MEHFSKYAPITQKCPNTAITRCKQLQVIALVLFCGCGMWVNKGKRRGHRRRRQSNLQQRGAQKTRHGDSGLPPYVLCETHSSGSIRREKSY
jgi:hypothetical protein